MLRVSTRKEGSGGRSKGYLMVVTLSRVRRGFTELHKLSHIYEFACCTRTRLFFHLTRFCQGFAYHRRCLEYEKGPPVPQHLASELPSCHATFLKTDALKHNTGYRERKLFNGHLSLSATLKK